MAHPWERLVNCGNYLRRVGMTQEQLTRLHHSSLSRHRQSFAVVLGCFSSNKDLKRANSQFLSRVEHVALDHKRAGLPLGTLMRDALRVHPLES